MKWVAIIFVTVFVLGCKNSVSPPNQALPMLALEPDSGRIGTVVRISDGSFLEPVLYNEIVFPGSDDGLLADSGTQSTIYSFVPFGAVSGQLKVIAGAVERLTPPFTVIEAVNTTMLTVHDYDISPAIIETDSMVVDLMGIQRVWLAEKRSDTVHISRSHSTGYEIWTYNLVLRDKGPGQLPEFLQAFVHIKPDYPGEWTDTVRAGILKIQDWDPNAVVSGRFFTHPSLRTMRNGSIRFWANVRSGQ